MEDFEISEQASEGFRVLFDGPRFGIHNSHALAVDFIPREDVDDLNQILSDMFGVENHPRASEIKMDDLELYVQTWKLYRNPSNVFEWIKVQVILYPNENRNAAFLAMLGSVSDDYLEDDLGYRQSVSTLEVQEALSEFWDEEFGSRMPGIVQETEKYNDWNLADRDRLKAPITLSSTQVRDEDFQSLKDGSYSEAFRKNVRNSQFCNRFGINHTAPMSITHAYDDSFILINSPSQGQINDRIIHDGYSFIQFMDPDGKMYFNHVGWNNFGPGIPDYPNNPPGKELIRALPFLYYGFWSFHTPLKLEDSEELLRNIPTSIKDNEELDNYLNSFHKVEEQFYGNYVEFLDNLDAFRTLLSNHQETFSDSEYYRTVEFEGEESADIGAYDLLTEKTDSRLDKLEKKYERVKKRYNTVTERLNKQANLKISERNKELAETSVDLQREVKVLTVVLTILTVALAVDALGNSLNLFPVSDSISTKLRVSILIGLTLVLIIFLKANMSSNDSSRILKQYSDKFNSKFSNLKSSV